MPRAHVQIALRIVRGPNLNPRMHTCRQTALDHPLRRRLHLRIIPCSGPANTHRKVGRPPLQHLHPVHSQNPIQLIQRRLLLQHQRHHNLVQRLHICLIAPVPHVRKPPRRHPEGAARVRRIRPYIAHTVRRARRRTHVRKQHAVEPGPHRPLRNKLVVRPVDLDHRAQAVQFGCPANVVQIVQRIRSILRHKLHIIVQPRMTQRLHHVRPHAVYVRCQRRFSIIEQLANRIRAHRLFLRLEWRAGLPLPRKPAKGMIDKALPRHSTPPGGGGSASLNNVCLEKVCQR